MSNIETTFMNMHEAIEFLDGQVTNPSLGLSEALFLFVSKITPMVNVDLLIKDERGHVLLSWRNDEFAGRGWHVPGGILRYQETLEERIEKTAAAEIGMPIKYKPKPVVINQIIDKSLGYRGHFISVLYECFLPADFVPENAGLKTSDAGFLMWHESCPVNLIKHHRIYRKYFPCFDKG